MASFTSGLSGVLFVRLATPAYAQNRSERKEDNTKGPWVTGDWFASRIGAKRIENNRTVRRQVPRDVHVKNRSKNGIRRAGQSV